MKIDEKKLEIIIDLILEYVDVEVNVGPVIDELEAFPFIHDSDKKLLIEKIKKELE